MPIGVPLSTLKRDLRAETGQSLNVAQGVQAEQTYQLMLDRQQRELWDAYSWPHLRYYHNIPLQSGQNAYDYPDELPFDQVNRIYVAMNGGSWKELAYGVTAYDVPPPNQALQTGTPEQWWHKQSVTGGVTQPTGQIVLNPVPDGPADGLGVVGVMQLEGQCPYAELVDDTDKCIIDSTAIVLFTAAEILASQKSETAALKLTKAQNWLRRLLQNQGGNKRPSYNMGGPQYRTNYLARRPYAVPGIDYIP